MWGRKRRTEQRAPSPSRSDDPFWSGLHDVASECELFLAGRYQEHLRAVGRPTPPWAWLNELAHGSLDQLRVLAAEAGPRRAPEWQGVVAFMASEILACAEGDEDGLLAVQDAILVPLELRLAARWFAPCNPAQLLGQVMPELKRYRQGRTFGAWPSPTD